MPNCPSFNWKSKILRYKVHNLYLTYLCQLPIYSSPPLSIKLGYSPPPHERFKSSFDSSPSVAPRGKSNDGCAGSSVTKRRCFPDELLRPSAARSPFVAARRSSAPLPFIRGRGWLGDRYLSLSSRWRRTVGRSGGFRSCAYSPRSVSFLPAIRRYVKLLTETLTDWMQLRHFTLAAGR